MHTNNVYVQPYKLATKREKVNAVLRLIASLCTTLAFWLLIGNPIKILAAYTDSFLPSSFTFITILIQNILTISAFLIWHPQLIRELKPNFINKKNTLEAIKKGINYFGLYFLFNLALILLITNLPKMPGYNLETPQALPEFLISTPDLIIFGLSVIIIAPIAEEIIFRGYIYNHLKQALPIWLAILLTSLLFGISHGQIDYIIPLTIIGIFLNYAYYKTNNILTAIVFHGINNSLKFLIILLIAFN